MPTPMLFADGLRWRVLCPFVYHAADYFYNNMFIKSIVKYHMYCLMAWKSLRISSSCLSSYSSYISVFFGVGFLVTGFGFLCLY
jgi:hypothetical protein